MTTRTTVFQCRAPSAALASRIDAGTSASTSCVERATSGIMITARANDAFHAAWPLPDDEQREDEDADHDRGDAVQDVERELHDARRLLPRELARVERDEDAHRNGHGRRERHDHGVPTIASATSTRLEAGLAVRRLGEEVEVDRAESASGGRRRRRSRALRAPGAAASAHRACITRFTSFRRRVRRSAPRNRAARSGDAVVALIRVSSRRGARS